MHRHSPLCFAGLVIRPAAATAAILLLEAVLVAAVAVGHARPHAREGCFCQVTHARCTSPTSSVRRRGSASMGVLVDQEARVAVPVLGPVQGVVPG